MPNDDTNITVSVTLTGWDEAAQLMEVA